MTNQKRAAEVIEEAMGEVAMGYPSMLPEIAQALADNGLLMPDLPEPDNAYPEWLVGGVSISPGLNAGEVDIEWDDRMLRLAPGQVLAFLAAANYIERNQE